MAYRTLGNSGLKVSILGYGFWATFGVKGDLQNLQGVEAAKACLREARKYGVNFFDNAETYGDPEGEAERIMGEALRQLQYEDPKLWRRSDILVSTKLFWGGNGQNEMGLSVKHLREGMAQSLRNLQLDHVDVVFAHRPDGLMPTEAVVRGMTDLVRSGKATCWGTSEWSAQQITEAVWIARAYGLEPPVAEQPQYHLFHRERFEKEYFPLFQQPYNLGTAIWSPLASGLLTGKYSDGIPPGSRLDTPGYEWLKVRLQEWKESGRLAKFSLLKHFAETELGTDVSTLAIAWCLKNPNVSTVLLGASSPAQISHNVKAIALARTITPAHLATIEGIVQSKPTPYQGWGVPGCGRWSNDIL